MCVHCLPKAKLGIDKGSASFCSFTVNSRFMVLATAV